MSASNAVSPASPVGAAAAQGTTPATAGGAPATGTAEFSILSTRAVLFDRLPPELKAHVAFRHFYTDEFGGESGELSLRLSCLFITYFCTLCRLEARRKHYLQSPSEKSGASFTRAHSRARSVFLRLNATYSAVLMKYNVHSDIVLPRKPRVVKRAGQTIIDDGGSSGRYAIGAKPMGPGVRHVRAFEYAADELRFYEELYVFIEQVLRRAFTDERLQGPVAHEINMIFRGRRFNFGMLEREATVRKAANELDATMDSDGGDLKHNLRQLAEVLIPPAPKISVKEAAVQRTPLIASRFRSGKMNSRKYQRPGTALGVAASAAANASSAGPTGGSAFGGRLGSAGSHRTTGSALSGGAPLLGTENGSSDVASPIAFPPTHRAVAEFLNATRKTVGAPAGPKASAFGSPYRTAQSVSRAATRLKSVVAASRGESSTLAGKLAHTFLPKLQDFDVPDSGRSQRSQPQAGEPGSDQLTITPRESYAFSREATSHVGVSMEAPTDTSGALGRSSEVVPGSKSRSPPQQRSPTAKSPNASGTTAAGTASRPPRKPTLSTSAILRGTSTSMAASNSYASPAAILEVSASQDDSVVAPIDSATGRENWRLYDPMPEIDKVYQSMANGVVISSLAIPSDIHCVYDATGVLLSTGES